jgi:hypothetical protein
MNSFDKAHDDLSAILNSGNSPIIESITCTLEEFRVSVETCEYITPSSSCGAGVHSPETPRH